MSSPGAARPWPIRHDLDVVVVAAAVCVGAWLARPVPWIVVLAALASALAVRRPVVLACALALLAGVLAARGVAGLAGVDRGPVTGHFTLTADPQHHFGGVQAEARGRGRRWQLEAHGASARVLDDLLAGDEVAVRGQARPASGQWLRWRHVGGRIQVDSLVHVGSGRPWSRLANLSRRILVRGADEIPPGPRSLFLGFVLGDDRDQSVVSVDDFRGSGLAHLLVVSGQNVAFVLAVASPLARRLGSPARLVLTVAILGFFALVARFEPSVLRAVVMAGLAAGAASTGRRTSTLRLLAGAVVVLVLADPFLVHSLGFVLSVGASAGIAVLAGPLAELLPGPRWLVGGLSVTLAAQIGVAPVLVPVFGPMPLAAVPANVLAEPVAGAVMVWGLTGGAVAGLMPAPVAHLLHLPTRAALWWVAQVARWGARAPLGQLGAASLVGLGGVGIVVWWARRHGRSRLVAAGGLLMVLLSVWPAITPPSLPRGPTSLASVGVLWHASDHRGSSTVLVLEPGADPGSALEGLRRLGVDRIDLVVSRSGGSGAAALVVDLGRRVALGQVWGPEGNRLPGAAVPPAGVVVAPGGLRIEVERRGPTLGVALALQ